jgi:NDP-sugar pyrophosphorylase family protein
LERDRIVVIAGDAMLDIDLQPLFQAHVAHGAFATLATIPVADPSLYGVVVTAADGRIQSFQEKPAPGSEISHQANTGIYIFEPQIFDLIPPGVFCDFAMNIFPEVLRRGLPFYAFPVQGYWTDIGNPGDYLHANLDYLAGCVNCRGAGERDGENLIAAGARTDGARLSRCVVGATAQIAPGSHLTACVIWPGTTIDAPLSLDSAVITPEGIFRIDGRTAVEIDAALAFP